MSPAPGERFALDALPALRWKNGGGLTREIAAWPAGATLDDFDWRLSVAEVARDGPFSRFPGVDRHIVLLSGPGMRLWAPPSIDHVLDRAGEPFAFEGTADITATLLGGSTRDLNVMTRRGIWRAQLHCLRAAATVEACDAGLLLCGEGSWTVAGEDAPLRAGEGLFWRAHRGPHAVAPSCSDAQGWLLAVSLCNDRTP